MYTLGTRLWSYGRTCSFFSGEKKEPKKSRLGCSPVNYLSSVVLGAIYGKMPCFLALIRLAQSQRRFFYPCLRLTQAIILQFRDSANGLFCLGSNPPRHVRHPSAAQIADSAVRFTPAVKRRRESRRTRNEITSPPIQISPCSKFHLECVSKREIRKFEWIFRQFKE